MRHRAGKSGRRQKRVKQIACNISVESDGKTVRISYACIGNVGTMSIWLMNNANTAVEVYGYKYNYTSNKNILSSVNKVAGANPGLDRTLTTATNATPKPDTTTGAHYKQCKIAFVPLPN